MKYIYISYSLTSQYFSTLPKKVAFLLNVFVQTTLRSKTVQRGLAWMRTKSAAPHFQDLRLEKPGESPLQPNSGWKSRGYPKAAGRNTHQTQHKRWLKDEELMFISLFYLMLHFLWKLAECLQRCERPLWKSSSLSRPRLDICKSLPWKMWSAAMESPWKIIIINFLQLSDVQSPNHCFESLLLHRLGVLESINKGQYSITNDIQKKSIAKCWKNEKKSPQHLENLEL